MSRDDFGKIIDFASERIKRKGGNNTIKKSHMVQLIFSPEAFKRLNDILKLNDSKTIAETIKSALRLLEWYLSNLKAGYKIRFLLENSTHTKEVEIDLL